MIAAQVLLLDQQQVRVAGLEDAQMPVRDGDVGQLWPERRRVKALAGINHLDQALRADAGLLQLALIGGQFRRLLLRLGPPRRRGVGLFLPPIVVLRLQALQQGLDRHVAGIDPLLGARPELHPKHAHRLARDLAQPLLADRIAPALLLQGPPQLWQLPQWRGGRGAR